VAVRNSTKYYKLYCENERSEKRNINIVMQRNSQNSNFVPVNTARQYNVIIVSNSTHVVASVLAYLNNRHYYYYYYYYYCVRCVKTRIIAGWVFAAICYYRDDILFRLYASATNIGLSKFGRFSDCHPPKLLLKLKSRGRDRFIVVESNEIFRQSFARRLSDSRQVENVNFKYESL